MRLFSTILAFFSIILVSFGQSNLTRFTPSALLGKGQFEIQNFNNLYTQNSIRDASGSEFELNQRQIFLNSAFMFTYGVSTSSKFNIGLDFNLNRAAYFNSDDNPLGIFSNGAISSRTALGSIAARLKFAPIAALPRLAIQSSISVPVAKNLETPRFVAHDRYNWWTQIFYDKSIGQHFQAFFELDLLYRFKRQEFQENFFRTPASVFLSYFPSSRVTFYTLFQHSPAFGKIVQGERTFRGQLRWFSQWGLGTKYQLTDKLGIELSYSTFFASRNDGAGNTVNLGFRFIN
ncbi:MAG: hypothetical protein RJQ09_04530 [Cyclobacteriaceae bacterium]